MAVALKQASFATARELAAFCVAAGNNVTSIISITRDDAANSYTLFYT